MNFNECPTEDSILDPVGERKLSKKERNRVPEGCFDVMEMEDWLTSKKRGEDRNDLDE